MGPAVSHEDIALNPGPGNWWIPWDLIFIFAGLDAKTAANAFSCVYKENPTDRGITCVGLYLGRAQHFKG